MLWTKTLQCALTVPGQSAGSLWLGPPPDRCKRAIEAHHAGEHGVGQKAPDDTVIPLCDHHHDALTDRRGVFSGWPRGAVKTWELAMVALYQSRYRDEVAWQSEAGAPVPLF